MRVCNKLISQGPWGRRGAPGVVRGRDFPKEGQVRLRSVELSRQRLAW